MYNDRRDRYDDENKMEQVSDTDPADARSLFEYLLRLGDNDLILGHRLSELCGHAPVLEEELALSNIALDLIGQAQLWLELAGEVEAGFLGAGRNADQLAYRRDIAEFRNLLLVEQPNGNFADTMARQFYFDLWHHLLLEQLSASTKSQIAAIAGKSLKEVRYHLERSSDWVIRLGDGTELSHQRMQQALDEFWIFTGELFMVDAVDQALLAAGIGADIAALSQPWQEQLAAVLSGAGLVVPQADWSRRGGKQGIHSEHLGYLLAEMQFLQRAYPDASW